MSVITDIATSPAIAVPLSVGTCAANFVAILPILINVAMLLYIATLLAHKAWVWYREWKGKQVIIDKDELP